MAGRTASQRLAIAVCLACVACSAACQKEAKTNPVGVPEGPGDVMRLDERPIKLGEGPTQLVLVAEEPTALVFHAEINSLSATDYATPQGNFTRLAIPGYPASQSVGRPELPKMNRLVSIPFATRARIEVVSTDTQKFKLADLGIDYPLMPSQAAQPKCGGTDPGAFVCDSSAYQASRIAEPVLQVASAGRLRNIAIGRLELSPVQYFPATAEVQIITAIDFKVVFEDIVTRGRDPYSAYAASPFFTGIYGRVAGAEAMLRGRPNLVGDVVTYLIVTPPEFVDTLAPLVAWKKLKGFRTLVAVTGTPEVGTSAESIRDYIHGLYLSATAEQPAPTFLLLVGDIEQVPTFTLEGNATDRPYSTIDDDLIPDIYYGRFPAASVADLEAMIDKTLTHEMTSMPDLSYFGRAILTAGVDAQNAPRYGNGQINYGTQYYFNEAHGVQPFVHLYPDSAEPTAAAEIVAAVSAGAGIVNYTAHGGPTYWVDPIFEQSDVRGLHNEDKYPVVIGNCCLTSSYQVAESFSETWLRVPKAGAIGYIGGSNFTYWDEDYWWGVGAGEIVEHPTFEQNGAGAYDGLFHDHGEPMSQWFVTADSLVYAGNLAVTEAGSERIAYYWNIYNLAGDPSIYVHTRVPTANEVEHPSLIFSDAAAFTIKAQPGSYVGLSQEGELIGAGLVRESGQLTLAFWRPLANGILHVVITGQNLLTYQADVTVTRPASVLLDPPSIRVSTPTSVRATLTDTHSNEPLAGVLVWAAGFGYATDPVVTDQQGRAVVAIDYAYGPDIAINFQSDTGCFSTKLPVEAQPLVGADLHVETDFGLVDAFARNLPARLVAEVPAAVGDVKLAVGGDVETTVVDGLSLNLTPPAKARSVQATLAVAGYDLYSETFKVVTAYGRLAGTVSGDGKGLAGVALMLADAEGNIVADLTSDVAGHFASGRQLPVGSYTLAADFFAYHHWQQSLFVGYGDNTFDVQMTPLPTATLRGVVTDAESAAPIAAAVRVLRADDLSLVGQGEADAATGEYAISELPMPYSYIVEARAAGYMPARKGATIDGASAVQDFALTPTMGDILVLEDEDLHGALMTELLSAAGFGVTLEAAGDSDPTTWPLHELVVLTTSDNRNAVATLELRAALRDYVKQGHPILTEGGEVSYTYAEQDQGFASEVLHVERFVNDDVGNFVPVLPAHPVFSSPNAIAEEVPFVAESFAERDGVVATSDATVAATWSQEPDAAALILYEPTANASGARSVNLPFALKAMDPFVRPLLVQNVVTWLLAR
jgi:hypothetical protein